MDGYIIDWSAIAAFLAAGAALYGVWRGSRTAQHNLSAELDLERVRFRERWIQTLREEMSNLAGHFSNVNNLNDEAEISITKHAVKVLLLMNPADEDYIPLKKSAQKLISFYSPDENPENADDAQKEYLDVCQRILKREWDRLNLEIDQYKKKNNAKNK